MNKSRLVCYIDESGCSGDKYNRGSSQYLSLGAVVYDRSNEQEILSIFDKARSETGKTKKFKKFSSSSDHDNFLLTNLLAEQKVRTAQVILHKPSMAGSFTRSHHKEEYQFLCKFLLERVSWIARDSAINRNLPDTKCDVIFSEQKMYPYEDLRNYLNLLRNGRERFNTRTEWQYLHEDIACIKHKNEHPVHLADIVASATSRAVEPKMHGITDDRFLRNLSPVIYRKNGNPYGIKLFPTKEIAQFKEQGYFSFLKLI